MFERAGTEWSVRKVTLPLQFVRVAMRAESLRWWKRGEEGQLIAAGGRAGSRQAGRQAGRALLAKNATAMTARRPDIFKHF